MSNRSGSTTPLSLRKKVVAPTEYQDTVPGEFEEKVKAPKPLSQSYTQDSRSQTPLSEYSRKEYNPRPSPKLTRPSSKVFEKVRGLEERRRSLDTPEGSISGRSWAGFNRAGSVDSDDGGSRLGISRESSKEDLREALTEDAAERRSMFRQRAASLEEKPRYTQKVQDIENKFTEELQRIKKLVGKPHLKKSFSTEQLTLKGKQRQPLRKIEPIPPQVLKKLQEREQAQWAKEQREQELNQQLMQQGQQTQQEQCHSQFQKTGPPESMRLSDLPGQRSVRELSRVSPVTEIVQRSSSPALYYTQREESPSRNITEMTIRKVDRRPPSPLVQRVSRIQESPHGHESLVQATQQDETSGRKTPMEVVLRKRENRPESPLVQKRGVPVQDLHTQAPPKPQRMTPVAPEEEKMEVELPKQTSKIRIPTIIVEDEKLEEVLPVKKGEPQQITTSSKERQQHKTKGKNRRPRPLSPELGLISVSSFIELSVEVPLSLFYIFDEQTTLTLKNTDSSDDSYVSAGEDPMEAPVFECLLQDAVASSGSDVLLKCIIAGTPIPEGIMSYFVFLRLKTSNFPLKCTFKP